MWKDRDDYSTQDEMGRWINTEFPPDNLNKYPNNSGYRTSNREMLFYQFAVQYYDVTIEYRGLQAILIADEEGCVMTDIEHNDICDMYPTANDLIKNFKFSDGKTLIDVVDDRDFKIDIY